MGRIYVYVKIHRRIRKRTIMIRFESLSFAIVNSSIGMPCVASRSPSCWTVASVNESFPKSLINIHETTTNHQLPLCEVRTHFTRRIMMLNLQSIVRSLRGFGRRRQFSGLSFEKASVIRHDNTACLATPTLSDVTWDTTKGQHWLVTGPTASGKTTLLEAVAGKHRVVDASRDVDPRHLQLKGSGRRVEFVGFATSQTSFYARYNGLDPDDDVTLLDFFSQAPAQSSSTITVFGSSSIATDVLAKPDDPSGDLHWAKATQHAAHAAAQTDPRIDAIAKAFGLQQLLSNSLITLSNGQMRRARIARALLSNPRILCLDEPYAGLDVNTIVTVNNVLQAAVASPTSAAEGEETQLIMALRPADFHASAPPWAEHAVVLDGKGGVAAAGKRSDDASVRAALQAYAPPEPSSSALSFRIQAAKQGARSNQSCSYQPEPAREALVHMRNVTVTYGSTRALQGVSWTIRRGERWGLIGPSGSGKTTLLALLTGDHLQAYSNTVILFGTQRGDGDNIWDIRRRTGFSSAELHAGAFTAYGLTVAHVISTGFGTGITASAEADVSAGEKEAMETVLKQLNQYIDVNGAVTTISSAWFDQPFATQPTGAQRLALFIRAVVKQPELLILDEPFQSMDPAHVDACRAWLDAHLTAQQALVLVSHHAERELPSCTNRLLGMGLDGRVAEVI